MGCYTGLSKCLLVLVNVAVFVIAAASLGISIYLLEDQLGSRMLKDKFVVGVLVGAVVMMLTAVLGCRAAMPSKRVSRCIYWLLLLCVVLAQVAGATLIFNFGNVLQKAHDKGYDIDVPGAVDKATSDALRDLHDEVAELYQDGGCSGGSANSTTLPVGFSDVRCGKKAFEDAFRTILEASTITTKEGLSRFHRCTALYTADGRKASTATQVFCASEEHIVEVAQRYINYILWFPVCMCALSLVLLVATTVVMCRRELPSEARQLRSGAACPPDDHLQELEVRLRNNEEETQRLREELLRVRALRGQQEAV